MTRRFDTWLVLCAALTLAVTTSHAQAPESRLSLERTVAAICAKADADGDSYRPFVCDPRCDCLADAVALAGAIGPSNACEETAPGDFALIGDVPRSLLCEGFCSFNGQSGTSDPCNQDSDCPLFFGFDFCTPGNNCNESGAPCFNDVDCPGLDQICYTEDALYGMEGGFCPEVGSVCSVDADCSVGFSCVDGGCQIPANEATVCNVGALLPSPVVCATLPPLPILTLGGVAPADSSDSVQCAVVPLSSSEAINSNDALECITQIETAIGQACTPYSP
jgi:hypothetical protein